jgi:dTDP-4-dehydrorhamnose reductase
MQRAGTAALSPRIPLPLLITGISGVAGFNALYYFRRLYPGQVIGVRPEVTWQLVGPGIVAANTEDLPTLEALFRQYRFGSVLNATGNCALKSCELAPDMAHRANVVSARHLATLARHHDCRLVHLSCDLVYSGIGNGQYRECDPVDPVTVYGKTVAEAERVVAQIHPGAAILRISLPMGPSFNRHAGAIDWIQSRFCKNRPATLYYDEVRSATYCDDLNRVFAWFLANDVHGLFHTGGPRPVTLNQIGQIVNKVGGYAPSLLHGCLRHEAGPIPPRAGNVTMNSERLYELLGHNPFQPWPKDEAFMPSDRDWHYRRPANWPGSFATLAAHLYRYPDCDSVVEAILNDLQLTVNSEQ